MPSRRDTHKHAKPPLLVCWTPLTCVVVVSQSINTPDPPHTYAGPPSVCCGRETSRVEEMTIPPHVYARPLSCVLLVVSQDRLKALL